MVLGANQGHAGGLTWLQGTSRRAGCVVDPPQMPSQKDIRIHLRDTLGAIARSASSLALGHKSLFFCQSRALTESMTEQMRQRGTSVFVHTTVRCHGKADRQRKSGSSTDRMPVSCAPQRSNSVLMSGISTWCCKPTRRPLSPRFSNVSVALDAGLASGRL